MNNFGIVGYAGSGKDTTAGILQNILLNDHSIKTNLYAFAGPLKQFAMDTFQLTHSQVYDQVLKEVPCFFKVGFDKLFDRFDVAFRGLIDLYNLMTSAQLDLDSMSAFNDMCSVLSKEFVYDKDTDSFDYSTTPRKLLQLLGTEFFRDCIVEDFWTGIAPKANTIFTDVRFQTEVDHVNENNGVIIKVTNLLQTQSDTHSHSSEQLVNTINYDHLILNNGESLSELSEVVEKMVSEIMS